MAKKSTSTVTKQQTNKRIDLIADIFIGLSGLWLALTLLGLFTGSTALDLNLGIEAVIVGLQCVMAIGLLKRNKNAYYAARLLGLLVLIGAVLTIPSSFFGLSIIFSVIGANPIIGLLLLSSMLTSLASVAIWIYLFFLLISKPAKGIFQIK